MLLLAGVSVAACSSTPVTVPGATWPVPREPLPAATSANADALLTCGGSEFPAAGLKAPAGAEDASGPENDALRAALAKFGEMFQGSETWSWRLAGRDDKGAIFLAETDSGDDHPWVAIEVTTDASGWQPATMGQCSPLVVLSAAFGPATWALDPDMAPPTEATTELNILVWERACSSGNPATGRMSAPVVEYTTTTVTITIGVRPLEVPPGTGVSCPMPPGTPASLQLAEPLGPRTLLDGGPVPPAPPSPANGS